MLERERERESAQASTGATSRAERDPKAPPPPKTEIQALTGHIDGSLDGREVTGVLHGCTLPEIFL